MYSNWSSSQVESHIRKAKVQVVADWHRGCYNKKRRSNGEHELYRRMKTQFFIEMEGFDSGNDQILLIGATNRPQELDETARRRLTKRLYIPLPSSEARALIVRNLLEKDGLFNLSTEDVDTICQLTEGYSGSDMRNVVKDAAMGPVREALKQCTDGTKLKKEDMRPITLQAIFFLSTAVTSYLICSMGGIWWKHARGIRFRNELITLL